MVASTLVRVTCREENGTVWTKDTLHSSALEMLEELKLSAAVRYKRPADVGYLEGSFIDTPDFRFEIHG